MASNARKDKAVEQAFIQGMAIATANAVRQETWYPDEILGGLTIADLKKAGAEQYDIAPIRKALKDRGRL